jgi:hypothetical protein
VFPVTLITGRLVNTNTLLCRCGSVLDRLDSQVADHKGVALIDTLYQAGSADQAHMTRSLQRCIRHTPARIAEVSKPKELSILCKTLPFGSRILPIGRSPSAGGPDDPR